MVYVLKQELSFSKDRKVAGVYSSVELAINEALRLLKRGGLDTQYSITCVALDRCCVLDSSDDCVNPVIVEIDPLLILQKAQEVCPALMIEAAYCDAVKTVFKVAQLRGVCVNSCVEFKGSQLVTLVF